MARIEVSWDRGGNAALLQSDGNFVTVESDTAAAPGTPLSGKGTLAGDGDQPGEAFTVQLKVRGCKRTSEDPVRYTISGRFMNLSAKLRESLISELSS